jgi:group I intron endonuclease
MNTSGIYAIVNRITNDMYIGSAVNMTRRWTVHKHHLKHGTHHCVHLQNSYDKHTSTAFDFDIVEFVDDKSRLINREQVWIDFFKPKYNKRKIADSCLGIKRSAESRAKMSAAQTGKKQSPEVIAKRAEALRGKPRPDHVKAKISASHVGIKPSEETRRKMSISAKNRKRKESE